jgi:hypothetical protein
MRRRRPVRCEGDDADCGPRDLPRAAAGDAAQVNEFGAAPGDVGVDALRVRDRALGRSRVSAPGLAASNAASGVIGRSGRDRNLEGGVRSGCRPRGRCVILPVVRRRSAETPRPPRAVQQQG